MIHRLLHLTETTTRLARWDGSEARKSNKRRPGATILSFTKRLSTPPNTPAAQSRPSHVVNPQDPVSLLTSHVDVLDSLRDYAELTHVLATELIGWRSAARVGRGNIRDIQAIATIATLEASRIEAYRRALEPWLDHFRDQDR